MKEYTQKELTDALDRASVRYYRGLPTQFSDTEFDLLLKELQELEKESGVILPNSPTQRVGSDIQDGFKKGRHPKPMYTIENVYDEDGLEKWLDKMSNDYGVTEYNISIKYDGISCELHYHDGMLVEALTRGDKIVGDDITENVKTIKSVPLVLHGMECYVHDFYVRGEILLPKSKLKEINEERVKNGDVPFANTRNACSGSVKQLDPRVTAKRGLIFRAWDCFSDNNAFSDMLSKASVLVEYGFSYEIGTIPFGVSSKESAIEAVKDFKQRLLKLSDDNKIDFDYDGIVVKVDSIAIQDEIGTKDTRAIEWAIARKWNEEYIVNTKLIGVDWQVGRTGVLTPVGRLEPVECGGVVISNVTLNNIDFIEKFNLHIGDVLKITRSGGVIPYVLDVETSGKGERIVAPHVCPECGALIARDGALLKCTDPYCPAVVKGRLLQFCSKDCMDIRSIGESVVDDLYENNLVREITDFYRLKYFRTPQLMEILGRGYGEKKIEKILAEIEKSKEQPWDRVLAGLSIPGVGKVVARTLAKMYDLKGLIKVSEEELMGIEGIGEIMAHDIHSWFGFIPNKLICLDLAGFGLNMSNGDDEKKENLGDELHGLVVCFTGASDRFKGDEVEEFLEKHGAKCASGVSKKLDYLITGSKPGGSKVAKAQDLGVEIIDENNLGNDIHVG